MRLGSYGQFQMDWVGYADDLVIVFEDMSSLQRGLILIDKDLHAISTLYQYIKN